MSKQESFKFLDKAKWLISLSFFVVAVVGNSYYTEVAFLYRVLGVVGLIGLGILFMALTDFGLFIQKNTDHVNFRASLAFSSRENPWPLAKSPKICNKKT